MKKLLALGLTIVLICSSVPAFAVDGTAGQNLFKYHYIAGDETGDSVLVASMRNEQNTAAAFPSESGFSDVDGSEWFAPFVSYAKSMGYVSGTPEGMYKPHTKVSSKHAAVVVLAVLGYQADVDYKWSTVESDLGNLTGISIVSTPEITRGQLFEVLWQAVSQAVMKENSEGKKQVLGVQTGKIPPEDLGINVANEENPTPGESGQPEPSNPTPGHNPLPGNMTVQPGGSTVEPLDTEPSGYPTVQAPGTSFTVIKQFNDDPKPNEVTHPMSSLTFHSPCTSDGIFEVCFRSENYAQAVYATVNLNPQDHWQQPLIVDAVLDQLPVSVEHKGVKYRNVSHEMGEGHQIIYSSSSNRVLEDDELRAFYVTKNTAGVEYSTSCNNCVEATSAYAVVKVNSAVSSTFGGTANVTVTFTFDDTELTAVTIPVTKEDNDVLELSQKIVSALNQDAKFSADYEASMEPNKTDEFRITYLTKGPSISIKVTVK